MTHDELLANINNLTVVDGIFMKDALRAVVELHKPITSGNETLCAGCPGGYGIDDSYPCPTIQAIEKELT